MGNLFSVIESTILAITLLVTVYLSYRGFKLQKRQSSLLAAEEFSIRIGERRRNLETHIGFIIKVDEPERVKDTLLALTSDVNYKFLLFDYLNTYESFARGVLMDVYDEQIFRAARGGAVARLYGAIKMFLPEYRKAKNSPNAWSDFERLAKKWAKDKPI